MNVRFFGSQSGGETSTPLSYTGSPWELLVNDMLLFFQWVTYLPNIVIPLSPSADVLDELHRSPKNLYTMFLHAIAFISQSIFLISLPWLLYLPFLGYVAYVCGFIITNKLFCRLLNGKIGQKGMKSTTDAQTALWDKHDNESWIFLNGVAVGDHWLRSNIDKISRTFRRPVVGVHNQTSGIIFDVIQCLIQRCLLYATPDVRDCYVLIKEALYRDGCDKVILILHSQGAIEGSMIIDWLLNEVPQSKLQALEVYTFGNAANHFNNPYRDPVSPVNPGDSVSAEQMQNYNRAIAHIEHYANSEDFVSCWGVLNYTKTIPKNRFENRFMGRVFERAGKGHQFNQHYLDNMFPLEENEYRVREPKKGDFMDMDCVIGREDAEKGLESVGQSLFATNGHTAANYMNVHLWNVSPTVSRQSTAEAETWEIKNGPINGEGRNFKVKDLSRLWCYRNGGSPDENTDEK